MSPTYSICQNHGYIGGEAFKCPDCGNKTEVYSRITGYYRPVQNWNDGKSQEYKERRAYNAARAISREFAESKLNANAASESCSCAANSGNDVRLTLFTTNTCPNCRIAKTFLDKANLAYDVVVSDAEPEKAIAFDIRQAPTLVVQTGDKIEKLVNLSDIRRYIDSI